jgi:hypothetical protein
MRAAFRYVGIFALLAGLSPADAARAVRVYEVAVREPVAAQLAPAAMRIALVRATGRRDAASDPALASLVGDAQRYVRSSRPGAGGRTDVTLDGVAIERAILAAGRAVWPAERPLTLVVLDVPAGSGDADAARMQVEAVAGDRGLPVSIVPAATLGLGAGAIATRELLLPAAQRLGADAVLVGRNDGGGAGAWQWTLMSPAVAESWSGTPEAAAQGAVDAFVRVSGASAASADSDVIVTVSGVKDLAAYAGVSQALAQVPGVRRVALEEAEGATARFRVTTQGSNETLATALAGHARLVPATGATPGVLSLAWLP